MLQSRLLALFMTLCVLSKRLSTVKVDVIVTFFTDTSSVQEGRDDDALVDFQAAAAEGSGFAKSMLVEMNPYAAMCNAMLR